MLLIVFYFLLRDPRPSIAHELQRLTMNYTFSKLKKIAILRRNLLVFPPLKSVLHWVYGDLRSVDRLHIGRCANDFASLTLCNLYTVEQGHWPVIHTPLTRQNPVGVLFRDSYCTKVGFKPLHAHEEKKEWEIFSNALEKQSAECTKLAS